MAKNTEATEEMQATEQVEEAAEKTVKVCLPFAMGAMEDDVFVGLNGRTFLIQRGVEVEVPIGVKEILDRKKAYEMEANAAAIRLQSRASDPGHGM